MSRIRNVVLEFLRHGPPHNQLLSPLTRYLALCGNHSGVSVSVPYEHAQFLARHQILNYELDAGETTEAQHRARQHTELQLQITAAEMAGILAEIPGLISELTDGRRLHAFTHLEIVLSASELALLPFELANAPQGFPGAGQPLALQSQHPLCITRRVRRVGDECSCWPDRPRILFAHALPPADAARLVPAHLLALRNAVAPWVGLKPGEQLELDHPPSYLAEYLTVLPHASVQSLFAELRKDCYTHVHLLAHGVEIREGVDVRFGLALRDAEHPLVEDRVSASRLTTLFRAMVRDCHPKLTLPAVVTLASCHGAAGGSVVGAGASVAHALHEAGIPLVVASQFPLSFPASVLMVQTLYDQLLWGCDPRVLLCDLRRQLKLRLPHTHDWASLVAYASLPADLETRGPKIRFEQAKRAIEAAFSLWDADAPKRAALSSQHNVPENTNWQTETELRLEAGKNRLKQLDRELQPLDGGATSVTVEDHALVLGRLASTEKRQAEIEFYRSPSADRWRVRLRNACRYYHRAFCVDRSQTWALAQEVALTLALDGSSAAARDAKFRAYHTMACQLLAWDRGDKNRIRRLWALGNLMELETVSLWLVEPRSQAALQDALTGVMRNVRKLAQDFQQEIGEDDWELVSHRRQLIRYLNWLYRESEPNESPRATAAEAATWDQQVRRSIRRVCQSQFDRLATFSF
jgi:hypothetical protein